MRISLDSINAGLIPSGISLVSSLFVIFFVRKDLNHKKELLATILLNLSVADALKDIFYFAYCLLSDPNPTLACSFQYCFYTMFLYASVLFSACIALSTVLLFTHKSTATSIISRILPGVWVLSVLLTIPDFILILDRPQHNVWQDQHDLCAPHRNAAFYSSIICWVLVIVTGVVTSIGSLVFFVSPFAMQRLPDIVLRGARHKAQKYVLIALICWCPAIIYVMAFTLYGYESMHLPTWYQGIQIIFLELQSSFNLLAYILSDKRWRHRLFSRYCDCLDHETPIQMHTRSVAFGNDQVRMISCDSSCNRSMLHTGDSRESTIVGIDSAGTNSSSHSHYHQLE